jgi:hypothetical protein
MAYAPLRRIRADAVVIPDATLDETLVICPDGRRARPGISRRCCMLAAALCLGPGGWALNATALAQHRNRGGCMLAAAQGTFQGTEPIDPHTVAEWPAIGATIPKLNTAFGVRPLFGFMDDREGPNAMASFTRTDRARPDGTVMFGVHLLQKIRDFNQQHALPIVVAVMAHEWAHIKQNKTRAFRNWIVKDELSADYLAGWFLRRNNVAQIELDAIKAFFGSEIADTDFQDPDHHGTPAQRAGTIDLGFAGDGENRATLGGNIDWSYVSE